MSRIIDFFKNLFKRNKQKLIEEPKQINKNDRYKDFINSIRVSNIERKQKKKEITTLICEGDGLGIKKRISY